ncbi:hypothetical protein GPJ56_006904 [Histomonas meleagridis]|uniref:uncharacterized protein n=1 Tax=Histomonas meleagridis TaxID=135588 RepID=UPI00355A07E7|nr:hypothetical protein GPJ56_006904 [Histomonas meleagridis]KAH0800270.1 hypothetical protein GO595_006859 [Histomonas meleagridis]
MASQMSRSTTEITWALSFKGYDENSLIFALFSSTGIQFWFPLKESLYALPNIGFVPNGKAAFSTSNSNISLLFEVTNGSLFLVPNCEEPEAFNIPNESPIRCMGSISDDTFAIISENNSTTFLKISSQELEVQKFNPLLYVNPFRQPRLSDSKIFISDQNYIYSVSKNRLSVFSLETLEYVNSVSIPSGSPISISTYQTTTYILTKADSSLLILLRISDVITSPTVTSTRKVTSDSPNLFLVGVDSDTCCICEKYTMLVFVFTEKVQSLCLNVSNSFDDYIMTASTFSQRSVSVCCAKSGYYELNVLSPQEMLHLLPEQIRLISKAFHYFKKLKSNKSFLILSESNPTDESFSIFDHDLLMSFTEDSLNDHLLLVQMYTLYSPELIDNFEINAYNYLCLRELKKQFEDKSEIFEFNTENDLNSFLFNVKLDFEHENFSSLEIIITLIQICFEHYDSNQYLYPSKVLILPELNEIIDTSLQHPDKIPHEQYLKVCEISLKLKVNEEHIQNILKLVEYLPNECEVIGVKYNIYEVLAKYIHITNDYKKVDEYYDMNGDDYIINILLCLYNENYVADIIEIGSSQKTHKIVSDFISDKYDLLIQAFNAISDEPVEIKRAISLLWNAVLEGIENNSFTLDQASTFCSIALICCYVIDENELQKEIDKKFKLFELQKVSCDDEEDDRVLSTDELIENLIKKKDNLLALCAYVLTSNERNDDENGKLLASIIFNFANENGTFDKIENIPIVEALVESNAIECIPNSLERELDILITNKEIVEKVMNAVNEAMQNKK